MEKVLNIYKPIGLTPLQLITKLRDTHKEYKDVKIGYAGRLDPLAHGVMLLMLGDETKNRLHYLNLDKEYEFEVLFGISTDTYDALGILNNLIIKQPALPAGRFNNLDINNQNLEKKIKQFIKSKLGKQNQTYPPYSSKEVNGKPLFQWARENKLREIKIPEREVEIYNFELLDISQTSVNEIHKRIIDYINSVDGDFRQEKILVRWNKFFSSSEQSESRSNNLTMKQFNKLTVAKFKIACSSGTYVRSLTNELGKKLGCGAIAIEILRTKAGKYEIEKSIRLTE